MTIVEYIRKHFENVPEQDIDSSMCNEFAKFLKLNHNDDYCAIMFHVENAAKECFDDFLEAITDGSARDMASALADVHVKRNKEFKDFIIEQIEELDYLEEQDNERALFEATEARAINKEI